MVNIKKEKICLKYKYYNNRNNVKPDLLNIFLLTYDEEDEIQYRSMLCEVILKILNEIKCSILN